MFEYLFFVTTVTLFRLSTNLPLFEGDECILRNNIKGHCIIIGECSYAKELLHKQQSPQNCGFRGTIPIVCCPDMSEKSTSLQPGYRSINKCMEYFDIRYLVYAVFNGQYAGPKEFPHMTAVGYLSLDNSVQWLCGGTLISEYFILTAAHCTYSRDFGAPKVVRLGDLDLVNNTEDALPSDYNISSIIKHPQYKVPLHYHDIALLKLDRRVPFGIYYKPACLHSGRDLPGNIFTVAGWGKTDFFGSTSSHLQKADVKIIKHNICSDRYVNDRRRLPNGILDEYQICAGDSSGTDTCPGDSGGPLHIKMPKTEKLQSRFVIVGVTSFGRGCGLSDSAGVYTRVSSYISWIEDIVWPTT